MNCFFIEGNFGDSLTIYRSGMKYIDLDGTEYYLESERLNSEIYDFVVYRSNIKYYKDYEMQSKPSNIDMKLFQKYDKEKDAWIGHFNYKKIYDSNLSESKKNEILHKVLALCKNKNIKIEIDQK